MKSVLLSPQRHCRGTDWMPGHRVKPDGARHDDQVGVVDSLVISSCLRSPVNVSTVQKSSQAAENFWVSNTEITDSHTLCRLGGLRVDCRSSRSPQRLAAPRSWAGRQNLQASRALSACARRKAFRESSPWVKGSASILRFRNSSPPTSHCRWSRSPEPGT